MRNISDVVSSLRRIKALGPPTPARRPKFPGNIISSERTSVVTLERPKTISREGPLVDIVDHRRLFNELDEASEREGVDALAWYHPFHLSSDDWGIYIPMTSVHYVADRWFARSTNAKKKFHWALEALLLHELTHFACEYTVAQYEILLGAACWVPAQERLQVAHLDWFNDEEALANASIIRQFRSFANSSVITRICEALLRSPTGYRDFPSALPDDGYLDHQMEVLRHNVGIQAIDLDSGLIDAAFEATSFFPDLGTASEHCRVYIVEDAGRFDLPPLAPAFIQRIETINETSRFRKQFKKLSSDLKEDWMDRSRQLAVGLPRYPAFKKLRGEFDGLWGLYLRDGYRAHLRPASDGAWEAVAIGPHKEMGHG